MRNRKKNLLLGSAVVGLVFGTGMLLSGCDGDDGPGEELGETIDEGLEDAGRGMQKAGEELEDAAEGNN